jgi:hypothetical protein
MWRTILVGLLVAAAAAIAALVMGEFGDTHARIIGTSLGFSFFCALAASGDALRSQAAGALATAGAVATALAVLAFVLLVAAVWLDDSDWLWQTWGVVAVTALWASHWSLVLRTRRPGDSAAIRLAGQLSIVTATINTLVGNAAIAGVVDDPGDGFVRALGVVLVITVLTTAMPPIMRRLSSSPQPHRRLTAGDLAQELDAAAGRIERIGTAQEAQREAATLRRLAARARD